MKSLLHLHCVAFNYVQVRFHKEKYTGARLLALSLQLFVDARKHVLAIVLFELASKEPLYFDACNGVLVTRQPPSHSSPASQRIPLLTCQFATEYGL
jgi:hypothetical protein